MNSTAIMKPKNIEPNRLYRLVSGVSGLFSKVSKKIKKKDKVIITNGISNT